MELEYIHLKIRENIVENGKITKWMVKVYLNGQMGENIFRVIEMIKKMEMEVFIALKKKFGKKVYGIMVKELNG